MHFDGTSGDDDIPGTRHDDDFDLTLGGDDTAKGKDGFDVFFFGDTFTKRDAIDGGNGDNDTILLFGDYAAGVTISDHTMKNIEALSLGGGFDYLFTLKDNAVAAGTQFLIDGGSLLAGDFLVVHAESETNADYVVLSGGGGDLLATGAGDDLISAGADNDLLKPGLGNDIAYGGGGEDFIEFDGTGAFDVADQIDGGEDFDTLVLQGDYSGGLAFTSAMMVNVEKLLLYPGNDYAFDLTNLGVPTDGYFFIDGTALAAGDTLTVDASQLATYVGLIVQGGAGSDVLTGGSGPDTFYGGGGADILEGHGGVDLYSYDMVSESTGPNYDTIIGFDARHDFVHTYIPLAVDDPVIVGRLRASHFDADLAAAIGSNEMEDFTPVLFTPSRGSLAGELFLLYDRGGGAGYQAGVDLVIHFDGAKHMEDFGLANFG